MRSSLHRALLSASILLSTAPFVTACAGGPPIVAAPNACSTLVPSSHRVAVPGAEMPAGGLTAGTLTVFADAQTAQLDKANGHTADVLEIVQACEARDKDTIDRLQAPWWKRLMGGGI